MKELDSQVKEIQNQFEIVGRSEEIKQILIAYYSKKNILIEGEIGTGKTTLARAFASYTDKRFFRVDGSEDILSHVLVGYFDPPLVLANGYGEDAFLYGPLSQSMKNGGVFFINELNRLPESTQNVLLSALDEGYLDVPKLAAIKSNNGFITIATMNPKNLIGVTNLGTALKDRFVYIEISYQSEIEENEIIILKLLNFIKTENLKIEEEKLLEITKISVKITRSTRDHSDLRRGASIRAGIDLATLFLINMVRGRVIKSDKEFWYRAALMALSTKVELEDGVDTNIESVIKEIVKSVLNF